MKERIAHNKINLIGLIFENLTVVKELPKIKKWECKCDCGNVRVTTTSKLRGGRVSSCHACSRKSLVLHRATHGGSKTSLYRVWNTMKQRCSNPNVDMYYRYGGRGISVCTEWKESFAAFQLFAYNNGYGEGMSIEREDNDKGYTPGNCTFIPLRDQSINKPNRKLLDKEKLQIRQMYTVDMMSQSDVAKHFNVHPSAISYVLKQTGEKKRPNSYSLSKLSEEEVCKMIKAREELELSFRAAGEMFNVSGETARKYIKKKEKD